MLSKEWAGDEIIHVGDYASGNDGTTTNDIINKIEKDNKLNESVYEWVYKFKEAKPSRTSRNIRYVYNLDRKEYIDLLKQPIQWICYEDNKIFFAKYNSFALLIGCGNEQGGGDYFGINKKRIGLWAGDHFVSSSKLLKKYSNFNETTYLFDENLKINNRIKNFNQKNEKSIFYYEGLMFKKSLDFDKKYYQLNIQNLEIDKSRLTDNEYTYLNNILNKYKEKEKDEENNFVIPKGKELIAKTNNTKEISSMTLIN